MVDEWMVNFGWLVQTTLTLLLICSSFSRENDHPKSSCKLITSKTQPRKRHLDTSHQKRLVLRDPYGSLNIYIYVPWSKVAILGMVIPPSNRNPYNGYINPYYWVDDHPLLYGNNGSLDPGTYIHINIYIYLEPK